MMKRVLFLLVIIILYVSLLHATIIYIPTDQPTIQAGINNAIAGDTVLVLPDTYFENINFDGKNIVIGSLFLTTGDTTYIAKTVIDGDNNDIVVKFISGEDSNAVLTGFTVRNGYAGLSGGGILCTNSSPFLSRLNIIDNKAYAYGGGIYCENSDVIMQNLIVTNNTAGNEGGGILCTNSRPRLTQVTIAGNSADYFGGGIAFWNSNPILNKVTIKENRTYFRGGGIYCSESTPYFNPLDRCNIYLNYTLYEGNDIFVDSLSPIAVLVDTFTVIIPTNSHAYPESNMTFDIMNARIEPVNADLYVDPSGSDDNTGLSFSSPLHTAFVALLKISADSMDHHTVHFADGIYSPSKSGEYFPLKMKDYVSLRGESRDNVIIDAEGQGNVIFFNDDDSITVENMTISGGITRNNILSDGGGIHCQDSNPLLRELNITGNRGNNGGGIYCDNSDPDMVNVLINENAANEGGGIHCRESNPSLVNVMITNDSAAIGGGMSLVINSSPLLENVNLSDNVADHAGGGIHIWSGSHPLVTNSVISGNISTWGGGIYCGYAEANLVNVTIVKNTSPNGGGIGFTDEGKVQIVNTILWGNSQNEIYFGYGSLDNSVVIVHSDVQEGPNGIVTNNSGTVFWLDGNIDDDPLFVDTITGDFRLREGSHCIDAGIQDTIFVYNNDRDTLFVPLIDYSGFAPDMGAYEYNPSLLVVTTDPKPNQFALYQNFPNPFNPSTTITYQLPEPSFVSITIYNITGQLVETLVNEFKNRGMHRIIWQAGNLSSGLYFYQIKAGNYTDRKKMLLIK